MPIFFTTAYWGYVAKEHFKQDNLETAEGFCNLRSQLPLYPAYHRAVQHNSVTLCVRLAWSRINGGDTCEKRGLVEGTVKKANKTQKLFLQEASIHTKNFSETSENSDLQRKAVDYLMENLKHTQLRMPFLSPFFLIEIRIPVIVVITSQLQFNSSHQQDKKVTAWSNFLELVLCNPFCLSELLHSTAHT